MMSVSQPENAGVCPRRFPWTLDVIPLLSLCMASEGHYPADIFGTWAAHDQKLAGVSMSVPVSTSTRAAVSHGYFVFLCTRQMSSFMWIYCISICATGVWTLPIHATILSPAGRCTQQFGAGATFNVPAFDDQYRVLQLFRSYTRQTYRFTWICHISILALPVYTAGLLACGFSDI